MEANAHGTDHSERDKEKKGMSLGTMIDEPALRADLLFVVKHETGELFVAFAEISNEIGLLLQDILSVALIAGNKCGKTPMDHSMERNTRTGSRFRSLRFAR